MGIKKFGNNQHLFDLISRYEKSIDQEAAYFSEEEFNLLIDYYSDQRMVDCTLDLIESAIEQHQFSADFHIRKAVLLLSDWQREEQVLNALDAAEALAPGDLVVSLLRSEALSSLGMYEAALELLDKLKENSIPEQLSEIYVYESLVYDEMKEHERSFYALKDALRENYSNQEALSRLWFCTEQSGRYAEALELNEWILSKDTFSYYAYYNLGAARENFLDYAGAIEAYEYAFFLNPLFLMAYRDCAELCYDLENYRKAMDIYQDMLKYFDADEKVYLRIGQCYQKLGNTAIAKTFFEKSRQLNPLDGDVWFHTAECYSDEGKWKKAISFYKKAIEYVDRHEEYHLGIANAYNQIGEYEKAYYHYFEATNIAPEQSSCWLKYAFFLMDLDRYEEAYAVLENAEENAVDSAFLYCKSICLFRIGKRQAALPLLGEALYENYDLHDSIFDMMPDLKTDKEVIAIIAAYQPI